MDEATAAHHLVRDLNEGEVLLADVQDWSVCVVQPLPHDDLLPGSPISQLQLLDSIVNFFKHLLNEKVGV